MPPLLRFRHLSAFEANASLDGRRLIEAWGPALATHPRWARSGLSPVARLSRIERGRADLTLDLETQTGAEPVASRSLALTPGSCSRQAASLELAL